MGDGSWRAVFVGRSRRGLLSVGIAASASGPGGPWVDAGAPLIEDTGAGAQGQGQIDPHIFQNATGAWVIFKTDGNADGKPTPIRAARLNDNVTAVADGDAWRSTRLIEATLPWEGILVEAPWIIARNGTLFLFYSANAYNQPSYSIGVARAATLLGPWVKRTGGPLLSTAPGANAPFFGPGHCSVVQATHGGYAMVYHAYVAGETNGARHIMVDELAWESDGAGGEWPMMSGAATGGHPGAAPQPPPSA
jgi:beta-xylosidase